MLTRNGIGLVNIHKEKGYTSHDVVNIVRKLTKTKAGHTGTLDPNATGVLPVCLGRATKIADYVMNGDKEYVAQVIFGTATDTQDATGNVITTAPVLCDLSNVQAALTDFIGQITQTPPMYSAIKLDGKKLYEYARAGTDVSDKIKSRVVTIHDIEIASADLPHEMTIRVSCSKGTYIRTLCADLGVALGGAAHMGDLVRTKSGGFAIEAAVTLAQLEELIAAGRIDDVLIPVETALAHLPRITIAANAAKWLANGNKIPLDSVSGLDAGETLAAEYLAHDAAGVLAGIYAPASGDCLRPKVMLYTLPS